MWISGTPNIIRVYGNDLVDIPASSFELTLTTINSYNGKQGFIYPST